MTEVQVVEVVTEGIQVVNAVVPPRVAVVDVGYSQGIKGDPGEDGDDGDPGEQGETGPGVAAGGTTGQILVKASDTDYDTDWQDPTSTTLGYVHNQGLPAAEWTITHGLSFAPNVTVVDSGGTVVEGNVVYADGTVTVAFSAAFAGTAYLS